MVGRREYQTIWPRLETVNPTENQYSVSSKEHHTYSKHGGCSILLRGVSVHQVLRKMHGTKYCQILGENIKEKPSSMMMTQSTQ